MGDLITAKAASKKLGVSVKTLRGWVGEGAIPVWRDPVSGRQRFSVLELDDVLRTIGRTQAAERHAS